MVTVIAFNTGETTVQIPAIKEAHDHIHDIGSPEPVTLLIAIIPEHFQLFKMCLGTLEIITGPRVSGAINIIGMRSGFHINTTKKLPIYAPVLIEAHGKYSAEKSIKRNGVPLSRPILLTSCGTGSISPRAR